MILTSVLQAMGLFAATNIDDIIVLSLFFGLHVRISFFLSLLNDTYRKCFFTSVSASNVIRLQLEPHPQKSLPKHQ